MRNNKGVNVQSKITMNELFDLWKEYHLKNLDNPRSFSTYKAAWAHATSLHKLLVINVHVREIADCLESIDASANTISALKMTLNMMFDYAVSHELTDKNYAKMYTLPGIVTKETAKESDLHSAFTDQELKLIRENINTGIARLIYIQCFTGFRPSELLGIKTKDIDLFNDVIVGGMKTEYGRNRTVPIHSEIKPIIGALVSLANNKKSPYLISKSNGKPISYESYREHFISTLSKIEGISDHVPHDPRKTFITRAKYYGVDEYAIKRIVGHSIKDITEKTYTQRDNEWLKTEIEKIKRP
jgi:integrase